MFINELSFKSQILKFVDAIIFVECRLVCIASLNRRPHTVINEVNHYSL